MKNGIRFLIALLISAPLIALTPFASAQMNDDDMQKEIQQLKQGYVQKVQETHKNPNLLESMERAAQTQQPQGQNTPDPQDTDPSQMGEWLKNSGLPQEQVKYLSTVFEIYNSSASKQVRHALSDPLLQKSAKEIAAQFNWKLFFLGEVILLLIYLIYKSWSQTPYDSMTFRFMNHLIAFMIYAICSVTVVPYALYGKSYLNFVLVLARAFGF